MYDCVLKINYLSEYVHGVEVHVCVCVCVCVCVWHLNWHHGQMKGGGEGDFEIKIFNKISHGIRTQQRHSEIIHV